MKKTLLVLLTMLAASALFADTNLKFQNKESGTIVENFTETKKVACNKKIAFVNNAEERACFTVYGKTEENAERVFLGRVFVSGGEKAVKKPVKKIKDFAYIEVVCENGDAVIERTVSEKNDMCFYISEFKLKPASNKPAVSDR